jgi:hypothetical protein
MRDWIQRLNGAGWDVEEVAPGVVILERSDHGAVRFLKGTPHVHVHYLVTDDEADAAGGDSMAELCCHGCASALFVRFTLPTGNATENPRIAKLRDEFQATHRDCFFIGGEILCPPARSTTATVDLREARRGGPGAGA